MKWRDAYAGTVLINGNEITAVVTETPIVNVNSSPYANANHRARAVEWSNDPFAGTRSDYSKPITQYEISNFDPGGYLLDLGLTAGSASIRALLNVKLSVNIPLTIANYIFFSWESAIERYGPEERFLSCLIYEYENEDGGPTPLDEHFGFFGDYFPKSNYIGTPVSHDFYSHYYFF